MNMELTRKHCIKVTIFYGLIMAFANFVAVIIPITFSTPALQSIYQKEWIEFLNTYSLFTNLITVMSFSVPGIICLIYALSCRGEKLASSFINLPIAYSFIGITGWLTYYIAELIILFFVHLKLNIPIGSVILTSSMYIILESLLSFTLSYFCMEYFHRRIFLPKYFPNGNLNKIKGTKTVSLKFMFTILYVSAVLFPVFYLLSGIFIYSINNKIQIDKNTAIMFFFILLTGIVLFAIFQDHFNSPLSLLQRNAEQIKNGNYSARVNVVENDTFGILSDTFNDMSCSIDEKTKKIFQIQNSIITGMATMVESRDNSTGGHIKRTSECVKVFIKELKENDCYKMLSQTFCENVIKAAPMHDLGKIAVDDAILRKPGKFTDEEYEKMKQHSVEGARIIESVLKEVDDVEFKKVAVNVAHFHHEKYDGSGYPQHLKAEQIPVEARIMALADVFDALVSKRCYKDTFSYDKAFSIIQDSLGTHFDPVLGKIFIDSRQKFEELYNSKFSV